MRTALAVFLLLSHLIALAASWQGSWSTPGSAGPAEWLTASVAVVTALAGAINVMRWRLVGDASSLWIGAALLVYSAATNAFPGLVRSFADASPGAASWAELLRPASVVVVMALFAMAAAAPAVDARLTPRRVGAFAGCAALAAMLVAAYSSEFRSLLGPVVDEAPIGGTGAIGQVAVAALWLVLGVTFLFRFSGAGRQRAPWIAVMLLSLAEARLALAVSVHGDAAWMLASQLFRLFGVMAALAGAIHELQAAFALQRVHLLDSIVQLDSAEAARRAVQATAEERAHDLRSALAGIGGAAVTLERYHDQLSDDERSSLARAVAAEIDRLQQIVSDVKPATRLFELAAVLEPQIVCAQSNGDRIEVAIAPGTTVAGRAAEVTEVVQNLLDNARRHGGATPVTISAVRRGPRVEVRVEDRGPGVPNDARELAFERGWRGDIDIEGSGLGLFNARKLAREMDGDLWVEARPGGGATFVFTLPIARPAEGDIDDGRHQQQQQHGLTGGVARLGADRRRSRPDHPGAHVRAS